MSLAIVRTDHGYVKSKGAISRTCLWHAGKGLLFMPCLNLNEQTKNMLTEIQTSKMSMGCISNFHYKYIISMFLFVCLCNLRDKFK